MRGSGRLHLTFGYVLVTGLPILGTKLKTAYHYGSSLWGLTAKLVTELPDGKIRSYFMKVCRMQLTLTLQSSLLLTSWCRLYQTITLVDTCARASLNLCEPCMLLCRRLFRKSTPGAL